MKIRDIHTDLPEPITLKKKKNSDKIYPKESLKKSSDIFFKKPKKLSLRKKRLIQVYKNTTQNFDSFIQSSKYKDIFISYKNNSQFIQYIG